MFDSSNCEIKTPRLVLRDLALSDLEDLCDLCLDSDVTKYIDYIRFTTKTQVNDWLQDKIKFNNEKPRHSYNLVILDKLTGNVVGWIGIGEPSDSTKGDLDFGYAIKKEFWGKGYATEALSGLLDFAFNELKVHKIIGDCDSNNFGSIKVMQKVGMTFEYETNTDGKTSKHFAISM